MGFFQNQNFVALFHSGLQVFHEKKKGKEKVVCLDVPDLNVFSSCRFLADLLESFVKCEGVFVKLMLTPIEHFIVFDLFKYQSNCTAVW